MSSQYHSEGGAATWLQPGQVLGPSQWMPQCLCPLQGRALSKWLLRVLALCSLLGRLRVLPGLKETPHIWTPPPWGSPHILADVVGAGGIWAWTSHPNWEHLRRPTPAPGLPAEPSEAFAVIASWPSFYFCLALLPSFPTSTDPTSYPPASGNPTVMPS